MSEKALAVAIPLDRAQNPGFALNATLLGCFAFASCFFRLFIFPAVPLLPAGDALFFFVGGSRIVAGQLPYRDFFEILPVGTDLVYAAAIKLFGFWAWIPGVAMSCLAAGIVSLTTLIARRMLREAPVALPGLLLAGFAFSSETLNATHHWFCALAALGALLALMDRVNLPRVIAAGALAGLATSFTQTTGAAVAFALATYVLLKTPRNQLFRWRNAFLLIGVAIGIFAAVNGYFIWRSGIRTWLFDTVIFPLRYFGAVPFNSWRVVFLDFRIHPSALRWLLFPLEYFAVPLVFVVLLVAAPRGRDYGDDRWDHLFLVSLVGTAMYLAVLPSPSLLRLSSASAPGMILIALILCGGEKRARIGGLALGSVALLTAVIIPLQHQMRWHMSLAFPGGRIAFYDPAQYEEYRWLSEQIRLGDYSFGAPAMYVSFHVVNPAPLMVLDTGDYTRPEQVSATLGAFEQNPPAMIVTKGALDHAPLTGSDHTAPFRDYVRINYDAVKIFPTGDTAWKRK
jgi:hypothetical protein